MKNILLCVYVFFLWNGEFFRPLSCRYFEHRELVFAPHDWDWERKRKEKRKLFADVESFPNRFEFGSTAAVRFVGCSGRGQRWRQFLNPPEGSGSVDDSWAWASFFFRLSYDDRGDDFLVLFEQKESLLRKINTIKKKREKRNYSGFWFGKFAQKKKFVQNIWGIPNRTGFFFHSKRCPTKKSFAKVFVCASISGSEWLAWLERRGLVVGLGVSEG